jgi:hypothetical protein
VKNTVIIDIIFTTHTTVTSAKGHVAYSTGTRVRSDHEDILLGLQIETTNLGKRNEGELRAQAGRGRRRGGDIANTLSSLTPSIIAR